VRIITPVLAISLTVRFLVRRYRRQSTVARLETLVPRRGTSSTPACFQTLTATLRARQRLRHKPELIRAAVHQGHGRQDRRRQIDHCGGNTSATMRWDCSLSNSIKSMKNFASPASAYKLCYRFSSKATAHAYSWFCCRFSFFFDLRLAVIALSIVGCAGRRNLSTQHHWKWTAIRALSRSSAFDFSSSC